jgi:uncharacterized protein (TIGR03663 family)
MDLRDRTLGAVVGLTITSLLIRLVGLGTRPAHWDEGRVGYWIIEYSETGVLFYRPIVHGPLLKLVNAPLFELFGLTDFLARLFPAVIGGLLPLVALAFRHRLRDVVVIALAGLLALDPALLYYSRFARSDILVAAFCFVAFAGLVRAIDLDDGRYLPIAAVALALGFGAKENALVYVLSFVGAAGLLVGHRLVAAYLDDRSLRSLRSVLLERLRWSYDGARRHVRSIAGSVVAFVAVIVFVYAPRGSIPSTNTYYRSCSQHEPIVGIQGAPTLGEALGNPLLVPRLVWHTVGTTGELYACKWITPRADDPNPYFEYLSELAAITGESSTAIIALAVVGFAATVYRPGLPDDLVSAGFYWGAASVIGYPIATDIGGAAWLAVHVVLPLSIPAAVGAGVLYDVGRDAWLDEDTLSTALSVAIAVVLVGSMLWTGLATNVSSTTSEQNPLVQYAQPASDLRTTLVDLRTLADQNDGTDVVLVGENLSNPTSGDELEHRPTCADWFEILPLPWYFEAGDVEADCAASASALNESLAEEPPVVVVTGDEEHLVAGRLDDHERRPHRMRTTDTWYVYYVDESRLE